MKEIYKRSEKARIWIKHCVIPSIIPVVLSAIIDCYLGYTWEQVIEQNFEDLILLFFALALSVYCSAESMNENNEKTRNYKDISILFGLVCFFFYELFYLVPDGEPWVKTGAHIFTFIMGFIIIFNGMQVEELVEKELEKEQLEKEQLKKRIFILEKETSKLKK